MIGCQFKCMVTASQKVFVADLLFFFVVEGSGIFARDETKATYSQGFKTTEFIVGVGWEIIENL